MRRSHAVAASDAASAPAAEPPDEAVARILTRIRASAAGSAERFDDVTALHALCAAERPPKELKALARAFIGEEGPEGLYDVLSGMRGDWMGDARRGTLGLVSKFGSLPGPIGMAVAGYRNQVEAAAMATHCDVKSHGH